jgi:hypothetical protein
MEVELQIIPKDKTVFGISYQAGEGNYKGKQVVFHEVGIGIGVLVLYLVFYKKGGN